MGPFRWWSSSERSRQTAWQDFFPRVLVFAFASELWSCKSPQVKQGHLLSPALPTNGCPGGRWSRQWAALPLQWGSTGCAVHGDVFACWSDQPNWAEAQVQGWDERPKNSVPMSDYCLLLFVCSPGTSEDKVRGPPGKWGDACLEIAEYAPRCGNGLRSLALSSTDSTGRDWKGWISFSWFSLLCVVTCSNLVAPKDLVLPLIQRNQQMPGDFCCFELENMRGTRHPSMRRVWHAWLRKPSCRKGLKGLRSTFQCLWHDKPSRQLPRMCWSGSRRCPGTA